jgi:hypothetical protein
MNGFIWCRTAKLPKDVKGKYLVYRGNKTLITGNTRKTMREAFTILLVIQMRLTTFLLRTSLYYQTETLAYLWGANR